MYIYIYNFLWSRKKCDLPDTELISPFRGVDYNH